MDVTINLNAGSRQINWDAMVDPDGSIFGAAYVELLVSQYEKASAQLLIMNISMQQRGYAGGNYYEI